MNVIVEARYGQDFLDLERIKDTALFALAQVEVPESSEASVTFVTDDEIAELNEVYRGIAGPTDVLSFECDSLDDDFPAMEGDNAIYALGDIVIAPDVARKQAIEFGNEFLDEVDMLVVHGMLHLNGYDHIADEDAAVMESLQDAILAKLAASREA